MAGGGDRQDAVSAGRPRPRGRRWPPRPYGCRRSPSARVCCGWPPTARRRPRGPPPPWPWPAPDHRPSRPPPPWPWPAPDHRPSRPPSPPAAAGPPRPWPGPARPPARRRRPPTAPRRPPGPSTRRGCARRPPPRGPADRSGGAVPHPAPEPARTLLCRRFQEAVGEAVALVGDHPYHENPHAQLMRALYASGRRAAALEVYQSLRRRMTDGLGIPPSPSTTTLHHVMLQDRPDQRYLAAVGAGALS
ncbi:AfsR/SARP family transcriptional regulator [Streptomyces sp. Ag109_O5-1]|uniref:AfsR/SARP family transcriptional regulator n=1 Tax=Streptomyces sp. Ag109_O5-1 TaxID=1938851 RepID=UPI002889F477|nr:AfsR/SARP family transcriptional regulator [Streptomyces sp. Ag109_O5-1]